MNLSILNSLCYTAGWFWCVLLGIHGHSALAAIGAIFLILFQLYWARKNNVAIYIQDLLLVVFSIPLGLILEMFFVQTSLLHYTKSNNIFPPIWILSLYPLFSLLLNHSLSIIKKNYVAPFLFGFIAPLSYIAGRSLGGVTFSYPLLPTWIVMGICWGLFLCLLTKIAHIVEKAASETIDDRNSPQVVELLYDGECPLCKREICHLKKRGSDTNLKFLDIASEEFSSSLHKGVDYYTAMSQIHAIDSKGNLLVGIPAFAAVYARCNLLVTSTLMRIPFMQILLKPLYSQFAKHRLWITGRANTLKK